MAKKQNKTTSILVENLKPVETQAIVGLDGSMTFAFDEDDEFDTFNASNTDEEYVQEMETGHYRNLVPDLDEEVLEELAECVLDAVETDENSRSDYVKDIVLGLSLLGVKIEEKNEPFQGACSAQHPLLMESAVKFQSKASSELLPADGPVKTKVLGAVTPEREDQANRVKKHMNWQITEQMTEFYIDSEKLLLAIPIIGSGFKKTYYDSFLERPVSEYVPMDQFIVPHSTSDLERAPRYTHVLYRTENKFREDCASGFYHVPEDFNYCASPYKLTDIGKKTNQIQGMDVGIGNDDGGFTLYEHYCDIHIKGLEESKEEKAKEYKLAFPYIITVDVESRKVVGVRRNWKPEDKKRKRKMNFTHYQFVPGFGFYGFGFIHLLGNLQLTLTAALRSLVDAGQFANLQGGFKLKGVRISDDGDPINPGEFKEIEAAIMDINKAIMPLPFKGADQTLFAMLQFLTTAGQKFADSTENVIADSTNYGPVGTTMALLDASTKFFGAIHKRLHLSQKQELKIIANINAETLPDDYSYNIENESVMVTRDDYNETVDIVPVSDPNISSNAHRMAKAQTLFQFASQSPEVFDMREVMRHVLTNMDYANIDKIIPKPEEAQQADPLTDIQMAVQGKPIKAFNGQDHNSHIAIKTAFLQNPNAGGSTFMQKAAAAIQANIQEHMMLQFIEQTQAQAANDAAMAQEQGSQMPQQGDPTAQAAQKVAQMNQQDFEAKVQEQNAGNAEHLQAEANMILAQAELQSAQNDAEKIRIDEALKTKELDIKFMGVQLELIKEYNKLEAIDKKAAHDLKKAITEKSIDAMTEGLKPLPEKKPEAKKEKTSG